MRYLVTLLCCLVVTGCVTSPARSVRIPPHYQLVYQQSFTNGPGEAEFHLSDRAAWRVSEENKDYALELFQKSRYQPPFRSPFNIALLRNHIFGDFILEADMMSTIEPYGHQDMCIFFGYENSHSFYYAHVGVVADPHAHNVFIVNEAPRKAIAEKTTRGVKWSQHRWHKVRLERRMSDGEIKVYFDDLTEPVMVARDRTFLRGLVGFGSFDDLGKIDNVRIWAPQGELRDTYIFETNAPPQL